MRPEIRRAAIMDLLQQHSRLTVNELSQLTKSSQETIRRDLTTLSDQNLLRKFHGGAELPKPYQESPFSIRVAEHAEAKRAIARLAATLPDEGSSMFIDTGSTTIAFAEELAQRHRLTVVTNSPVIAERLARTHNFTGIFLLGGVYHADVDETVGSLCIEQIKRFRTNHVFLTIGALSADGIMNFDINEAEVARAMIAQADSVTILADASKFSRTALFEVGPLRVASRLVTNMAPPERIAQALDAASVEVLITAKTPEHR